MKRYRTSITVWPAIADLMTAIMIFGFLVGTLFYYDRDKRQSNTLPADSVSSSREEPINTSKHDSVPSDTLVSQIEVYRDSLKLLSDSVDVLNNKTGVGDPSCLDEDGSIMTIRMDPNDVYYITLNHPNIKLGETELQQYITSFHGKALSKAEMINFASRLDWIGENSAIKCNFYVQVENGGIPKDSFQLRWLNDLSRYFAGAVNSWILF